MEVWGKDIFHQAAAKNGALTAMLNYYRQVFSSSLFSKNWGVLLTPTLIICGENDTALGKELTDNTKVYVTHWQIKYIHGCGHWVQQEKPELVKQYIQGFSVS